MLVALSREMPPDVTWNTPDGGMFLWARLPAGMNAVALLPKAVEKNVAFVPGAAFYADNADPRCLRLSFVTASIEQINIGVASLAEAIAESRALNIGEPSPPPSPGGRGIKGEELSPVGVI